MKRSAGWRQMVGAWRPFSLLHSLDLALTDPPLLCCEDGELCAACRAETGSVLVDCC